MFNFLVITSSKSYKYTISLFYMKWGEKMETLEKTFSYSSYLENMSILRNSSRVPMGVLDLFKKRVDVINSYNSDPDNEEIKGAYKRWVLLDGYFDLGDGIAQIKRNGIKYGKVVTGRNPLWYVNADSELVDGALKITPETYGAFPSPEINITELRDAGLIDDELTKEQALKHPILKELLGEELEMIFKTIATQVEKEYGYDSCDKTLGIYLADARDVPTLRPWFVNGLGNGSDIEYIDDLLNDDHLVGVLDKKDGQ